MSASCSVFRGMSVDTVLQSCTWKSRNTFSDFYLRDMCTFVDDAYVMSSSVAGIYSSVKSILLIPNRLRLEVRYDGASSRYLVGTITDVRTR